jgi:hypothetical protein
LKKKSTAHADVLQFSSPVERILEVLNSVRGAEGQPEAVVEKIDWTIEIIQSNKLYAITVLSGVQLSTLDSSVVFSDKNQQDLSIEYETSVWFKLASESSGDSRSWGESELDNFLKGRARKAVKDDGSGAGMVDT